MFVTELSVVCYVADVEYHFVVLCGPEAVVRNVCVCVCVFVCRSGCLPACPMFCVADASPPIRVIKSREYLFRCMAM